MKRITRLILAFVLLLLLVVPAPAYASPQTITIPTFSIVSVVTDTSVTIKTFNFPANDNFNVLMGKMGTKGVNGIKVTTISSGDGGTFKATFNIPDALKGLRQIAIRLQSNTGSGYFAYNWFYNNTASGTTPSSGYTGFPTFSIVSVERNKTVTIKTSNLPAKDTFVVRMGKMGTRGVNGYKVTSFDSGTGGKQTLTFDIPAELKGSFQIAIRLESPTSGFFAYNWFYNSTAGGGTGGGTTPSYSGHPTFSIVSVVRNKTVTIQTKNLPANDKFVVRMGKMGTRGINGYKVTTVDSGSGGSQTLTFDIPAELKGSFQIAIRMESPSSGYFAYNWFYNSTTN